MSISELTAPTATRRRPTLPGRTGIDGRRDHVMSLYVAAGALTPLLVVYQDEWQLSGALLTLAFAAYGVGRRPHVGVALRPHRSASGAARGAHGPARIERHVPRRPRHRMGDRRAHRARHRGRRCNDCLHRRARRARPAEPEATGSDPGQRRCYRRTGPGFVGGWCRDPVHDVRERHRLRRPHHRDRARDGRHRGGSRERAPRTWCGAVVDPACRHPAG
jgi:hypothetical protein